MEGSKKDCTTQSGAAGEQVCSAGAWGTCTAQACTEGATQNCTQTNGLAGQKTCQGGAWTTCGPLPGQCQPGTYKQCTTMDNKAGFQKCDAYGNWGYCELNEPPVCNHGATQTCSNPCGVGTELCVNGQWQNCTAPQPQPEVCDGVDNNCNGQIDEACTCTAGQCQTCYTGPTGTVGVGQCKPGTQCCTSSGTMGPCQNQVLPGQENCADSIDNDCDGTVNDGCSCIVGQQQFCGTNVGECVAGVQICQQTSSQPVWGPCLNSVGPQAEGPLGCDGKDNDCDGLIDEEIGPDNDEKNDTCSQARNYSITDTDWGPKVLTLTLYPAGDIDMFRITAVESDAIILPPCCPWPFCSPPDAQCNFLEVELVQPVNANVQYKYSLLTGSCLAPDQTITDTAKKVFQWDGKCGLDDTKDFWIRVEPVSGRITATSCKPYTLKLRYWRNNEDCPTT